MIGSLAGTTPAEGGLHYIMGWLQEHMENFVKPVLGYVPALPSDYRPFFTSEELTVIKNMWRAVKCAAGSKPILLAGRDVFVLEILARREGYPTTFRPDISRKTVAHVKENYSDHFLFDTGFMGSIPKGLGVRNFTLASSVKVGNYASKLFTTETHQIFPRLKGARSLALKIERTPKYWHGAYYRWICPSCGGPVRETWTFQCPGAKKCCQWWTGMVLEGRIGQDLSCHCDSGVHNACEFLRAAYLTIEVYTNKAPRHVVAKEKEHKGCLGSNTQLYL